MAPPPLDEAWLARRRRLHEVFLAPEGLRDPGYLEEVGRRRRTWSEEELAQAWRRSAERPHRHLDVNHVYVHVPFCKSICTFCNYRRLRPSNPALLQAWSARLRRSLETLAPALAGHRFATLYVGGGTPSVLPPALFREVVGALERHVPFVPGAARTLEADPANASPGKVAAWREAGFRHVSFGVQSLRPEVVAAHDRGAQDAALLDRRVEELRAAGLESWSFDLLFGLAGTTPAQMLEDVDHTLGRWAPAWVDVYLLSPTPRYLDLHFEGSSERFWAHHAGFEAAARAGLPALARKHGYHLEGSPGHGFTLKRRAGGHGRLLEALGEGLLRVAASPRAPRLVAGVVRRMGLREGGPAWTYTQLVHEQERPLNLLGLGYSARSRVFGEAFVEYQDPDDDPLASGPAWYRGRESSLADEARSYLVFALRDGHPVPRAHFRDLFGADVLELLPAGVAAWQRAGLAELTPERFRLLPTGRQERAEALLWLFDDHALEHEILLYRAVDLSPAAVQALVAPLAEGDEVAPGVRVARIRERRLDLTLPAGALTVRLAPSLEGEVGLELVAEGRPPPAHAATARQALARLQALLRRNGADELGIKRRASRPRPAHPAARR